MSSDRIEYERALIEAIKNGGDTRIQALRKIFTNDVLKNKLIGYLKNRGCTSVDAEDLIQDAVIIFDRKASQPDFHIRHSIESYLMTIVKMSWLNRQRKNRKEKHIDLAKNVDIADEVEHFYERQDRKEVLGKVLKLFGDRCKELLMLYSQNYSMDEICAVLNFSDAPRASREKYRCLKRIKKRILSDSQFSNVIRQMLIPR